MVPDDYIAANNIIAPVSQFKRRWFRVCVPRPTCTVDIIIAS